VGRRPPLPAGTGSRPKAGPNKPRARPPASPALKTKKTHRSMPVACSISASVTTPGAVAMPRDAKLPNKAGADVVATAAARAAVVVDGTTSAAGPTAAVMACGKSGGGEVCVRKGPYRGRRRGLTPKATPCSATPDHALAKGDVKRGGWRGAPGGRFRDGPLRAWASHGGARHALPLFASRKTDKAAPFCPHRLHHHTGRVPAPSPGGSLAAVRRGRGAHSAGKTGGIQERARRRAPQAGGRHTGSGAFASRARSSQGLRHVARSTGRHPPPSPACKGRDRPRHAAAPGRRTNKQKPLVRLLFLIPWPGGRPAGGRPRGMPWFGELGGCLSRGLRGVRASAGGGDRAWGEGVDGIESVEKREKEGDAPPAHRHTHTKLSTSRVRARALSLTRQGMGRRRPATLIHLTGAASRAQKHAAPAGQPSPRPPSRGRRRQRPVRPGRRHGRARGGAAVAPGGRGFGDAGDWAGPGGAHAVEGGGDQGVCVCGGGGGG